MIGRGCRHSVPVLVVAIFAAACSSGGTSDDLSAPSTVETAASSPAASGPAFTPSSDVAPIDTVADAETGAPDTMLDAIGATSLPTTPSTLDDRTSPACVGDLSVREQAALLVWPSVYADDWAGATATVADNDIGGVLLMSQDGLDAETIRQRLSELESASRHGLIVATDEEGGDVQRLRTVSPLASQREISSNGDPAAAEAIVSEHAAVVRALGVDMVLGPVVDVEPNVGEVPLQPSRFFVGGPDQVTQYASAYLEGWSSAGLFATLKHYPGHGAASGDTHISAGVTPSLDDLRDFDLKPYRDLAGQATGSQTAVMLGHLTVPGLTDGVPATRSAAAVDYLRDDLGYGDAMLMTDALGMAAVGIPEPEASVLALEAGIDVVLFTLTSQTPAVIDAIEQAVADDRLDASRVRDSAHKVMTMLGRDGHTCNSNR
jgi:beta-N-acetylhexosaminidase